VKNSFNQISQDADKSDFTSLRFWLFPVLLAFLLVATAQYNFLLFHTLAELFAIIIAFIIFALAWKTNEFTTNRFLLFLACGYFWIGSLDLLHALVYKGMSIFPVGGANASTQFWIGTRYLEAILLFSASFSTRANFNKDRVFGIFGVISLILSYLILSEQFPASFIEGSGLTPFKVNSEYAIIAILAASIFCFYRQRKNLDPREFQLIIASIVLTMAAELAFTFYVSVYGLSNMVGHIFKFFSFWFIFHAVVTTNLKKPYQELIQSQKYNRRLFDDSSIGMALCHMDGQLIDINPAFAAIIGRTVEETKTLSYWDITPETYARDEQRQLEDLSRTGACGPYEKEYIHKDGRLIPVRLSGTLIEEDGTQLILSSVEDISEHEESKAAQVKAERELQESEHRFQTILDNTPAAVTIRDPQGVFLFSNQTFSAWVNKAPEEVIGKTPGDFFPPEQAAQISDSDREILTQGLFSTTEVVRLFPDGKTRTLINNKCPIYSADGNITAFGNILTDITEFKETEAALRQSQKMEAVGQLTGGLGHDFNNLLQIMSGNIELMRFLDNIDDKMEGHLDKVQRAVLKGKALTQRLLAFSRKQALSPKATDINDLAQGLENMLKRTLGEPVELRTILEPNLWSAMIDPDQLEHALVNLALNSRDAMPDGGKLSIETANITLDDGFAQQREDVTPGDYVLVAVTDTGQGMTPDDVMRAFDPFFTTKGVGEGSGLGLSMVYGFVKQSQGHVSIYSEIDKGTTVKIYLPRTKLEIEDSEAPEAMQFARGNERILIVEDDPMVREVPSAILRGMGYGIVEAKDGREAIQHLQTEKFDLLFTDVVLPGGMNGRQIADQARKLQPDIKILFATGYAENAIVHNGQLDKGVIMVNKPYLRQELLSKIRFVLGEGN
jgi:PAS domain S-box-containing protein